MRNKTSAIFKFSRKDSNGPRYWTIIRLIFLAIVIGSVWGLLEATVGGVLHSIHFSQKGAVMGGIAIALMSYFVSSTGKPLFLPLLGIIAASFKILDSVFFHMPIVSPAIVNPATAIIMEALVFTGVAVLIVRKYPVMVPAWLGGGLIAGFLAYIIYACVASLAGWGIWASIDNSTRISQALTGAWPMAVAGLAGVIAGYFAGKSGYSLMFKIRESYPVLFYMGSSTVIIVCWVIAGIYIGG